MAGVPHNLAAGSGGAPAERVAVGVVLAVTGDLRFLSHHDERRLLARALVRAGWPVAYSRGFNPQPRLSLPVPRSVGTAADPQWAWLLLARGGELHELFETLRPQLPGEYRLKCVVAPTARRVPQPRRICYEVDIVGADATGLDTALSSLLARRTLVVERDHGPQRPRRRIDIRPYIDHLELDGHRLRLMLSYDRQRTARPAEIITELGLAAEAYQHRLRRTEIQWEHEPTGPAYGPAAEERT